MKHRIHSTSGPYPHENATVLIADIQNYTATYESFRKAENDDLIYLVEKYFQISLQVADLVCGESSFFYNNSGDGFLLVFLGEGHESRGYLSGLILYQVFQEIFEDFQQKHGPLLSYGMGTETGVVRKINCMGENRGFTTYLGSVINVAARLESLTRRYYRTPLIIGDRLYQRLIQNLFPNEFDDILRHSPRLRKNYRGIIRHHNALNRLNQHLMLFYLFEHRLKGVDEPIPLYRLSPTLADIHKESFFRIVRRLSPSDTKYRRVFRFLKSEILK